MTDDDYDRRQGKPKTASDSVSRRINVSQGVIENVEKCDVCGGPAPEGRPRTYGDEQFEVVCRRKCDDSALVDYGVVVESAVAESSESERVEVVSVEADDTERVEVVLTVEAAEQGDEFRVVEVAVQ